MRQEATFLAPLPLAALPDLYEIGGLFGHVDRIFDRDAHIGGM
jgi:hypothetical protein